MTAEPSGKISFWIPTAFAVAMGGMVLLPYAQRLVHGADRTLAFSVTAPRPSFSCDKVTTAPALAICADPALASLDAQMGELYGPLVRAHPQLRIDQRAWIRRRNASCGGDAACLKLAITARIEKLKQLGS